MKNDLAENAKEVIDKVIYITIATTSKDGKPWNTPVYAVHDDQYNFFWSSWINASHSQNLRENKNVFIVIYDSTTKRGENYLKGVYIEGKAIELHDENEIAYALKYFKGVGNKELAADDFLGDSVKRIYKAVPEKIWLNSLAESKVDTNTIEMKVEVKLLDLLNH